MRTTVGVTDGESIEEGNFSLGFGEEVGSGKAIGASTYNSEIVLLSFAKHESK